METNLLPILLAGALIAFLMNQWTFVLMGDLVAIGVLAAAGFDKTLYLSVLVITALNYFLVLLLERVCVLYGRRRIGAHMLLSIALFFCGHPVCAGPWRLSKGHRACAFACARPFGE